MGTDTVAAPVYCMVLTVGRERPDEESPSSVSVEAVLRLMALAETDSSSRSGLSDSVSS
ncbi:hypothetical protein [Desulfospira joergensenii]|uniref:hypothetical protein n=1 Tax=Desulfospira joergensenii TaxID=53329 RepID=UPI001FCA311C|nr:hypothetical protein [Desulfospira joergensenii]